jgi:hypothetical protein
VLVGGFGEEAVEAAGEVALEAAEGFLAGLAFGDLALEVGAGVGVMGGAGDGDDVQGAVELAVAAAVQAVAAAGPGGGGDRCRAGLAGEAGVGGEALGAGGAADQRGGDQRAAASASRRISIARSFRKRDGKALDALAQDGAGDRERVDLVGLAGPALPAP